MLSPPPPPPHTTTSHLYDPKHPKPHTNHDIVSIVDIQ
jgi:hypothetical protein